MIDTGKLDAFIGAYVQREKLPGVGVCVYKAGREAFRKSYGIRSGTINANGDTTGELVTNDTIFGIASMSKGVLCAGLSILESDGKFSFDDRVDKYLPRVKIPGVPRESLTCAHLATHSSGLPPLPLMAWSLAFHSKDGEGDHARLEARREKAKSRVETIDDIIDYINAGGYPLLAQPGEIRSYSNDSFALLSYIADAAAGEPLEDFLRKRLFEPLHMEQTVLDIDSSEARKLGTVTELFTKRDDGTLTSDNDWDIAPPYRGTGWVKSTPSDMARFYAVLQNNGELDGKKVVPLARDMYGARFAALPHAETYGYGLIKRPFIAAGGHIVEHAGGLHGVATKGGFILDGDVAACVFVNWEDAPASGMLNACFNMFSGLPPETPHFFWREPSGKPANPHAYAGIYQNGELFSSDADIRVEGGELVVMDDGKAYPLTLCEGTKFVKVKPNQSLDRADRYEFLPDCNGDVPRVRVGSRVYSRMKAGG